MKPITENIIEQSTIEILQSQGRDYVNSAANQFLVVNQNLPSSKNNQHKRPKGLLLVNGLPLKMN